MQSTLRVRLKKSVDDSYDICIGISLNEAIHKLATLNLGTRYFILTDTVVKKFYGSKLIRYFAAHGLKAHILTFPSGEQYKSRDTKALLEDGLLKQKAGRDSVIVGFGGGVVGDLAGFIAATLHRGVPFVQIPTTLLAQVDSSIGGKVAVDHPSGKNLIGAFYQPKIVFIDLATLETLPPAEFTNGMAEVIKYAAIMDKKLFSFLSNNVEKVNKRDTSTLHSIVQRCCELKKYVVEKDEKETDLRRILNFGHTVGHAVEQLMNFTLPHGQAVAIGMIAETKISVAMGITPPKTLESLQTLLGMYNLPIHLPDKLSLQKILKATLSDKKAKGGVVHYTLLHEIGKAEVGIPLTHQQALSYYKQ